VVEVEASDQLNPSQEPVIHMGFVSVSCMERVSSASPSNLPIAHILPPISLIASQGSDVRVRTLMKKGDDVGGVEVEDGRR
jgi:hypothetical protein